MSVKFCWKFEDDSKLVCKMAFQVLPHPQYLISLPLLFDLGGRGEGTLKYVRCTLLGGGVFFVLYFINALDNFRAKICVPHFEDLFAAKFGFLVLKVFETSFFFKLIKRLT